MPSIVERDLNDIWVFVKVVDAGSFSAAARKLKTPTSTVSRRVARLEASLSVRLLQRTTRKLSLTEAGRLYYERSTELLSRLDLVESEIADAQQIPKGRIRVVAPVEHEVTMRLVNDFLSLYPDVRIDLELTSRPVNILEEGFDVSIHAGELPTQSVAAQPLIHSPFAMVASPTYIERRGTPQTLQSLTEHDCIIFGASSVNTSWVLNEKGAEHRIAVHGRIAVNHLVGVREAALAGHGIALLPLLVCAADLEVGRLTPVLTEYCPPGVQIYVTYPSGRQMPLAASVFVDFLKDHFEEISGIHRLSDLCT